MFNRREFLRTGLAAASGVIAWGMDAPRFLARTAWAAPPAGKAGARDTLLVVVQLTGGNDGLNTVVPYKDELYARYRPNLRLPIEQLKKINDDVAMHPAMGGFADLLEDKALCIVQGVGYPNPTQSHFESMDIWQSAVRNKYSEGWLGRALAQMKSGPAFHLAMPNEASWLALEGAPVKAPSIVSLEDFQLKIAAASKADARNKKDVVEGAVRPAAGPDGKPGEDLLDFVKKTAVHTYENSKRLQEIARNYKPKVDYPATGLAGRLKLAAQLIEADLGARIFYVSIDGFDTHSGQLPTHEALWRETADAIKAFFQDMAARGQRDRLLLMTFSEFGRRAKENGSKGTDHGSAAPMFLIGGKVKAGVVGSHPSLEKLEDGNLKHALDFRQVYAAVLDNWLGVSSKAVLGAEYSPVDVF